MKDRIKKLRKSLDLTQQEFANRIGVKRNTIATYEIGRNQPVDSIVSLICREFGVREEWLRTGEGEMFYDISKEEELADFFGDVLSSDDFKKRFVTALARLEESDWELLEKFVLEMAKD